MGKVVFMALAVLMSSVVSASDHDDIQAMRLRGDILPLSQLLTLNKLQHMRVLEAEFKTKNGQGVYELELLEANGRVTERYFDAKTGAPLMQE
jgi:uncharacterized membrane protein YkoI